MNENINLVEILKDAPRGTKLWSPLCGECEFRAILSSNNVFRIRVKYDDEENNTIQYLCFSSQGKYCDSSEAECLLFSSKQNRDWSTFRTPWKHKHFEPGQKVLVKTYDRENARTIWTLSLYSCYVPEKKSRCHYTVAGMWYNDSEIIAYKGNESKLGKPVCKIE